MEITRKVKNNPKRFLGYSEPDFGIRETKMDQNGPFWPKEVYFGPFRSANRTLVTPDLR